MVHPTSEHLRCHLCIRCSSRKGSMASRGHWAPQGHSPFQRHSCEPPYVIPAFQGHSRKSPIVIPAKITASFIQRRESSPSADPAIKISPPGIAPLHPSCLFVTLRPHPAQETAPYPLRLLQADHTSMPLPSTRENARQQLSVTVNCRINMMCSG